MTHASLETTTHRSDGTARIELRGDIDGSAGGALGAAYGETAGADSVLLDFGAVDYINSPGIALSAGIRARAPARTRVRSRRAASASTTGRSSRSPGCRTS